MRSESAESQSSGWSSHNELKDFGISTRRSKIARACRYAVSWSRELREVRADDVQLTLACAVVLEMIEPRGGNARMPGNSRNRALRAVISASTSPVRLGSAITRRLRELTLRFNVASAGNAVSPRAKRSDRR